MYLEKLVETFGQRTKYASLVDDYRKREFNPRDKELRRHLGRLNANSDMDRWKAYQWAQGVRDPKLLSNKAYRDAMRASKADKGMAEAAGYTGPMQAPNTPYSPSPEPAPAQRQFSGSFSPKAVAPGRQKLEAPLPVPGPEEYVAAPEIGEPDIGTIDGGIGEAARPMELGNVMPNTPAVVARQAASGMPKVNAPSAAGIGAGFKSLLNKIPQAPAPQTAAPVRSVDIPEVSIGAESDNDVTQPMSLGLGAAPNREGFLPRSLRYMTNVVFPSSRA